MIISRYFIVLCLFLSAALLCQGNVFPAYSAEPGSASFTTSSPQEPSRPGLVAQLGHSFWITSVCFSPDGRYVLTGSDDNTACLWDRETGKEVRKFEGHSVAFSPDGRYVLTGSFDKTARLWDAKTGQEVRRFEGHAASIGPVAFSPDGRYVLTGSDFGDTTARLWDVETGLEVRKFEGHGWRIYSIAFSPDGRYVLTGSEDNTARLWDVETGKEVKKFEGYEFEGYLGGIYSVTFSPDGRYVLTGGADKTALLWDRETREEVRKFGHADRVHSVAFSPDGRYVLTGSWDKTARLWDRETGMEVRKFEGHADRVYSVVFSPDGRHVLTGSWDKTARLWDRETGKEVRKFEGYAGGIFSVAFSPEGRYTLTGGLDKTARLWELGAGREVRKLGGHAEAIRSVAFSPDGRSVLTGSYDKTARLWDRETGKEVRKFEGHTKRIFSVAFSRDGRYVLTGSEDKTARLWDAATGMEVRKLEGPEYQGVDGILSVAFSPDGRYLLTGNRDGTAQLWDRETGEEVRVFERHEGGIFSVAFSQDGRYVLTGGGDKTALLWDRMTGEEVRKFEGHAEGVASVAFSPDGRHVLTGSGDNTARLWDRETGQELSRFEGHAGMTFSIAFSPDGRYVLTGNLDSTTRLWDATTGKELGSLISFRDGTWAVVDSEGRFDASNGGDVEGLHWVVGNEPIALFQLKERYYEPGLLAKIMDFNKEALRDVKAFKSVALYPAIELTKPVAGNPTLGIKLTNRGGGIGKVVVLINGKEMAADARGEKVAPDATSAEVSVNIKNHPYLVPGKKNQIEVKVYNAEGYLSSRGVVVDYDAPGMAPSEIPTLWAIVAGVSDYSGEAIDLRYAAKDARDVATALQLGGSRLFGADKVKLLTLTTLTPDKAPTKDNLRQAFKELQNAKPWDIVVVYLAGHGVAKGDEYYYLTREARSADLTDPAVRERVAISSAEMVEWIKQCPSTYQGMVLDTCAAGTFEKKLSEKRDISSDQVRALDRMKDRTGFHVLMGSAADRVSYEATQYEQGLLTYALLKGMKGTALREQEFIDVSTLFNHAVDEVPRLARNIGGIQSPRIAAPKGTSFDIGQLKEEDRQKIPLAQSKPFLLPPMLMNLGEGFDNLGLTALVRKKLREESYASDRGGARRLPVVYVDAEQFAGAFVPSGTYSVAGDKVQATVILVRDQKRLTDLKVEGNAKDPEALSAEIVQRIMATIQSLK